MHSYFHIISKKEHRGAGKILAQNGLTFLCHFGILVEVEVEVEQWNYKFSIIISNGDSPLATYSIITLKRKK